VFVGRAGIVVTQVVQIGGALLLLAAFAGTQFKWFDSRSFVSLVLNCAGSAILAVLAAMDSQWGFLLLEGVWSLVSLWGLIGKVVGREATVLH
jgi:hypothetical protein